MRRGLPVFRRPDLLLGVSLSIFAVSLQGSEPVLGRSLLPEEVKPFGGSAQVLGSPISKGSPVATLSAFPFDVHNRADTATYFNAEYALSENVAIGWTGTHSPIDPGTTSAAYRAAVIRRVNLFRAFAGVPDNVVENPTLSAKCQEAAMMMSVAEMLDHYPTVETYPDYFTADGAEAAGKSNLYLGREGPIAIDGYIQDPGNNNISVGHRNWILDPERAEMGTGDIPREGSNRAANALWVVGAEQSDPTTRYDYVAWPSAGYFPSDLVYPRWSFKQSGIDLSAATVAMKDGEGNAVPLTVIYRPSSTWSPIVWEPAIPTSTASSPRTPPTSDEVYHVEINASSQGLPVTLRYTVIVFDPDNAKPEITGTVFLDANDNGAFDEGEALPFAEVVGVGPGGTFRTYTREDGQYSMGVDATGTYTLSHPELPTDGPVTVAAAASGQRYTADLPLTFEAAQLAGATAANSIASPLPFNVYHTPGLEATYLKIHEWTILSRIEDAESGYDDLTPIVGPGESIDTILATLYVFGTQSFQLHHESETDRGFILSNLQPTANSVLTFQSRLLLSTSFQVARVQVSQTGQNDWQNLWTQAGNGGSESEFSEKVIALGTYAGQSIDLRFLYERSGSYYPQTHLGWVIDNIVITEDQAMGEGYSEIEEIDVSGLAEYDFSPPRVGLYRLDLCGVQGDNRFSGQSLFATIDPSIDPSTQLRIQSIEHGPSAMTFETVIGNFAPRRVYAKSSADLRIPFIEDLSITVEAIGDSTYRATVPATGANQFFVKIFAEE